MRQSSLGVIQRAEARFGMAVEVSHCELGSVGVWYCKAVGVRHCEVGYVGFWCCKAVEVSHGPLACA